jgi:hypothetical protein
LEIAMTSDLKQAFRQKLTESGLGFETLKVFGAIRLNVHVTCESHETANKWAQLLAQVFKGSKPTLTPTLWEAKENKSGSLSPTMRKGYLITACY